MTTAERRRHPRYPVDLEARLHVAGEDHPARVLDICRDAALVECAREVPLDEALQLSVTIGRGRQLVLDGRVIRDAGPSAGGRSFAVLFAGLGPAAATEIEVLLALAEDEGSAS